MQSGLKVLVRLMAQRRYSDAKKTVNFIRQARQLEKAY
jgi:hypothetical protein